MNMQTEGVRIPLWVSSLLAIVLTGLYTYIETNQWKPAVLLVIGQLVVLLTGTEIARSRVYSAETHNREVLAAKEYGDGADFSDTAGEAF